MHERIKYVSETEVRIERCVTHCCTIRHYDFDDRYLEFYNANGLWDDAGRDALLEALHCWKDTGSFAALSDESAVPYTGKRMRLTGGAECTVVATDLGTVYPYYVRKANTRRECDFEWLSASYLLPLKPQPKYRAYTPVEAAAHLGRTYIQDGNEYTLDSVRSGCVASSHKSNLWEGVCVAYDYFVTECTWADSGEPCGVRED